MSTIQDVPQPVENAAGPAPDGAERDARTASHAPRGRSRQWVALGAAAVLGVAGIAGVARLVGQEPPNGAAPAGASSMVPKDAPITLLDTLSGLPSLAQGDPTQTPAWKDKAKAAGAGATVTGRMYGLGGSTRSIRVVAGRTDLTGKLEQAWAADSGHLVGQVRCTNNTQLTASSEPRIRPTVMVCWRTSATLSVYSVIIDPKATTAVPDTDGAHAVDVVWQSALAVR